jgi:DNA-binding PadR family transcriptional regulator
MSVRQGLLAILDHGACFGYQLKTEFERRTGSTWPLNAGQVYNTLERLERDGLVHGERHENQMKYTISESGRREVAGWLGSAVVRESTVRDELAIKLAIAVTLPGVDIARVIQVQRLATMGTLQDLTRAKAASDSPETSAELAGLLVLDSLIFAAEAEIRWLDHSETRLARAAATGSAKPMPLNQEPARRGRPAKVNGTAQ